MLICYSLFTPGGGLVTEPNETVTWTRAAARWLRSLRDSCSDMISPVSPVTRSLPCIYRAVNLPLTCRYKPVTLPLQLLKPDLHSSESTELKEKKLAFAKMCAGRYSRYGRYTC